MAVRKLKEGEQVTQIQGEQGGSVRPVREGEEVHPIEGAGGGQETVSGRMEQAVRGRQREQQEQGRGGQMFRMGTDLARTTALGPIGLAMETLGPGIDETGETAMSFATGAPAQVIAGIAGTAEGVYEFLSGEDEVLADMVNRVNSVSENLTFTPQTEGGRELTKEVSKPFQAIGDAAERAGQATLDVTGSPAAATAVQTGIEAAPVPFSLRGARGRAGQREQATQDVRQRSRRAGVETPEGPIKPSPQRQAEQLEREVARRGGRDPQGIQMPDVARALADAKTRERQHVDQLYEIARDTPAGLPARGLRDLANTVEESLRTFDVDQMPTLRKRLGELDKIRDVPPDANVKMNTVQEFRQRINDNMPSPKNNAKEVKALNIMKGELDRHVQSAFNADMINGSPQAIQRWQDANKAFQRYRENFSDNKVIREMAKQQATAQEMRSWLFNTSAVGAKKEAANVVRKMKNILGEDSPQMSAVRHEAFLDIAEPLMRDNVSISQFKRNYDQFIRRNNDLVQELFPEDQLKSMSDLRDVVKGIEGRVSKDKMLDIERSLSRGLFGHNMSKSALVVDLATRGLRKAKRIGGKSEMRRYTQSILGYDAQAPILNNNPVVLGSTVETGQRLFDEVNRAANGQESDNE